MVEYQRRRTTHSECSGQYGVRHQIEARFDLPGELVAEINEPAAGEWQHTRLLVNAFLFPERIQRVEKFRSTASNQRVAGKSEQDVESPERAAWRSAL